MPLSRVGLLPTSTIGRCASRVTTKVQRARCIESVQGARAAPCRVLGSGKRHYIGRSFYRRSVIIASMRSAPSRTVSISWRTSRASSAVNEAWAATRSARSAARRRAAADPGEIHCCRGSFSVTRMRILGNLHKLHLTGGRDFTSVPDQRFAEEPRRARGYEAGGLPVNRRARAVNRR